MQLTMREIAYNRRKDSTEFRHFQDGREVPGRGDTSPELPFLGEVLLRCTASGLGLVCTNVRILPGI